MCVCSGVTKEDSVLSLYLFSNCSSSGNGVFEHDANEITKSEMNRSIIEYITGTFLKQAINHVKGFATTKLSDKEKTTLKNKHDNLEKELKRVQSEFKKTQKQVAYHKL